MKVKFQLPASLESISIRQFQEYHKMLQANKGAEDTSFVKTKTLSIFGGVPMEKLRDYPFTVFSEAYSILEKVLIQEPRHALRFELNGVKFGFIPSIEDISLGEYVDIESYLRSPEDYHKAMAVMYRPITIEAKGTYDIEKYEGSDKYAEIMKEASIEYALGAIVFFWTLGNDLVSATLNSLSNQEQHQTTENNSGKNGDGTNQSFTSQAETLRALMQSLRQDYRSVFLN